MRSDGSRERRDRLRERVVDAGIEALLVAALPNIRYLSGFSGSAAALLVLTEPPDLFVTDGRYRAQIAVEIDPALETVVSTEKALTAARAAARERGLKRIGFERAHLSVAQWEAWLEDGALELVGVDGWIEDLRAIKAHGEIEAIRRAAKIADHAFESVLDMVQPGIEERALALALDQRLIEAGSDGPAFSTIVAFGEHAALPHARPTRRALARGDVVLFDFGAVVDGYHSDISRTVACGRPLPEVAMAYGV